MFSKGSKPTPDGSFVPSPPPESAKASGVPSIISADLKIVGDLKSSGDIQVDGTVEGDVTSRAVTVGEGALVQGALVAETVRVYGKVVGEIKANAVVLASTAEVQGDIAHETMSMEAGASLVGQLSRLDRGASGGEGRVTVMKPEDESAAGDAAKTSTTLGAGGNGAGGEGAGPKPYGA